MWGVVYGEIEELTAETCIAGNIVKDCSTLSLHVRQCIRTSRKYFSSVSVLVKKYTFRYLL